MQKQTGKDSDDEDKYAEDADMPGQKFETKQRITVRNLRIREDTAKVRRTRELSMLKFYTRIMWICINIYAISICRSWISLH